MKIFVSIASYRDSELQKTINSLFYNAEYPENINVCVVSQENNNQHIEDPRIKIIKLDAKDAKGAGYARKLAMDMYDEEDFYLQIDSHMRFANKWDSKLISMYQWCVKDAGTYKIILSQFPAGYTVDSNGNDSYVSDNSIWSEPSSTVPFNRSDGAWSGKRIAMDNLDHPQKSWTVLAGYVFAHGSIVKDVPYDERISFMGEEICFALRAYTRGWEMYAPNEMLVWHFYKREGSPKLWNESFIKDSWIKLEKYSNSIQKSVLLGEEKGIFGIDDYDRYFDYQDELGIYFHDFYYSNELQIKINMSLLIEELDFSNSGPRTGYCINEMHDECIEDNCYCKCHKEK